MAKYELPDCIIDFDSYKIESKANQSKEIISGKYTPVILKTLIENAGIVVKKEELFFKMAKVQRSSDYEQSLKDAKGIIKRECPTAWKYINSVRGIGMSFDCQDVIEIKEEICTIKPDSVFVEPVDDRYIMPTLWLHDLELNAFNKTKAHAITGERGIGKTELAKRFAQNNSVGNRKGMHRLPLFKNIVFTSYKEGSLEKTIALLPCNDTKGTVSDTFGDKIRLLTKLESPTLLIIDNYDEEDVSEELVDPTKDFNKSRIYTELRNTGCYILFTSKRDMSNCFAVNQTVLKTFDTRDLRTLFNRINPELVVDQSGNIEVLIEKYLQNNTYLVTLAAQLSKKISITTIIESISNAKIHNLDDAIDGKDERDKTLFEHYELLYDLSGINNNEIEKRIMFNLAALPLEGIKYEDFFSERFFRNNIEEMKKAINSLERGYWIKNTNNVISLHPLVREIIITRASKFQYDYIREYIDSINKELYQERYIPGWMRIVHNGAAVTQLIENREFININEIAYLYANITSGYDVLLPKIEPADWNEVFKTSFDNDLSVALEKNVNVEEIVKLFDNIKKYVYKPISSDISIAFNVARYGSIAIIRLNNIDASNLDNSQLYEVCRAYSIVGHALGHLYGCNRMQVIAKDILIYCDSLLQKITKSPKGKDVDLLIATNKSNLAAIYMIHGDYEKCIKIHEKNRQMFERRMMDEETEDNIRHFAATNKALGTVYYYMANDDLQHERECIRKSYKYHQQAVDTYKKLLKTNDESYRHTIALAEIRKSGTLKRLMVWLNEREKIKCVNESLIELEEALHFLLAQSSSSLKSDNEFEKEMSDCVSYFISLANEVTVKKLSREAIISIQNFTKLLKIFEDDKYINCSNELISLIGDNE